MNPSEQWLWFLLILVELFYHALLLRLEDSSHTLEINSLQEKKLLALFTSLYSFHSPLSSNMFGPLELLKIHWVTPTN
jgi:hypothetical protein